MKHVAVTLQTELKVSFSDIDKAKAFFIDGDWKETFFEFSDVNELSEHLAFNFSQTIRKIKSEKAIFIKFIEGFGEFQQQKDRSYMAKDQQFGEITILVTSELETTS